MAVLLKMPLDVYLTFIERCSSRSREYTLLENAIVEREPDGSTPTAHILSDIADVRLLRQRAELFFPDALPYAQQALAGDNASSPPPEYRRETTSQIWHFCSNCSHWPMGFEYTAAKNPPDGSEICNECTVKSQQGECR